MVTNICMGHESIKQWSIVQQEVIVIAVYGRCWAIRKSGMGCCLPEVKTIVAKVVQEFQSVLQFVIVEFVWA
jgi:hypothetical protein